MQFRETSEFLLELCSCSGNAFQDEVVSLFSKNFEDFVCITTLPSGDGGVDGLYSGKEIAIFCYGLRNTEIQKTNAQKKAAIIKKFTSDMMRVLELKKTRSQGYVRDENFQLEGIKRGTGKIKHIKFICNWNEDNRIIGELQTKLSLLLNHSIKKFVDISCTSTFLGPKEIVAFCPPTKENITNLRFPIFSQVIKDVLEVDVNQHNLEEVDEFEAKFEDMRLRFGVSESRLAQINDLRGKVERNWIADIIFKEQLAKDSSNVHESLINIKDEIVAELDNEFLREPLAPKNLLDKYSNMVKEKINAIYPFWDDNRIQRVVEMMIASLIGECPMDWREGA